MRFIWILLAAMLPVPVLAEIQLSLSQARCLPGDVIELHAESSFAKLATFELKLPQQDALHLVAHQRQPVSYTKGVYSQKDVWVLQPLYAGTVELSGVVALVDQGGELAELELPTQILEVERAADTADNFMPEALPDDVAASGTGRIVWILLPVVLAVVAFAVAMLRNKREEAKTCAIEERPTLDSLKAAVLAGELPDGWVELILADDTLMLSEDLRTALERAAYGQGTDLVRLQELLGKEGTL